MTWYFTRIKKLLFDGIRNNKVEKPYFTNGAYAMLNLVQYYVYNKLKNNCK